jgi:hypothetical protein
MKEIRAQISESSGQENIVNKMVVTKTAPIKIKTNEIITPKESIQKEQKEVTTYKEIKPITSDISSDMNKEEIKPITSMLIKNEIKPITSDIIKEANRKMDHV